MTNNTPETNTLDQSAADLGMGGHLAPEQDDAGYRKRMERRQECNVNGWKNAIKRKAW